MKQLNLMFVGVSVMLMVACGTKPPHEDKEIENARLVPSFKTYSGSSSISIDNIAIEADVMTLIVGYSGGCEKHEFALIGEEAISKSLPPKRSVMLYHNDNGDACREYITDTLKYNIEAFGYKAGEPITLEFRQADKTISYTPSK